MNDDRVCLAEAARLCGLGHAELVYLIVTGLAEGGREGREWRVNPDSLPDPPPPLTCHRPIILRESNDGWLRGSVNCGDRAPRREQPPEEPPLEAAWRIIRPADPPPEDPSA